AGEFARLLAGTDAARLIIAQGAASAQLRAGDTVVFARLMEGPFPDVDRVIPREWHTRVRLASAELRQAVSVAALFWSSSGGDPLRLEAAAGCLRLRAPGTELGDTDRE